MAEIKFRKCSKCGEDMAFYQEAKAGGRKFWKCNICNIEEDLSDNEEGILPDNLQWTDMVEEVETKLNNSKED